MTELIDNPPPLPPPATYAYIEGVAMQGSEYRTLSRSYEPGCAMFSPEQYRAGEAAAFARGVAARQAEIAGLLCVQEALINERDGHARSITILEERVETLRAKLKAMEEQKPVAHFAVEYDMLGRPINFEQVVSPHGMPLYTAAGAKQ